MDGCTYTLALQAEATNPTGVLNVVSYSKIHLSSSRGPRVSFAGYL